jgi:hypothetical protein
MHHFIKKFFLFDKLQTSQTPPSSRPLPKTRQRSRLLRPVGAASTSASFTAFTQSSYLLLMLPWLAYSIVDRFVCTPCLAEKLATLMKRCGQAYYKTY